MFYSKLSFITSTMVSLITLLPLTAYAQMGPDLKPPGLPPDHPVNAYSAKDPKNIRDDWRFNNSWELNTNDVVFSASKKRQLISEAPSTIHVITDRDIQAHGWRSLPEILRHVPGVQTMTTHSQFQSVMIRGLVGTENNNSRILWLQNGVPMNDVRDSGIWLDETYPVEFIKRIEIVLGPGSALYGSGAFQGVVNIFTKDPKDIDKYGEYRVAMQNNLTFKASAIAAYQSDDGDLGFLAHVAANTSQGPGLIGDHMYLDYLMNQGGISYSDGKDPDHSRYESIHTNSFKHWYNTNFKLNYKNFKWNFGYTGVFPESDGSEKVPFIYYDPVTSNNDPGVIEKSYETHPYKFVRNEFYTDFIYEDNFGDNVTFLALLSYRFGHYKHTNYGGFGTNNDLTQVPILGTDGQWSLMETDYSAEVITRQHKLYGLAQAQWRIYDANELIGGFAMEYHRIHSDDFMDHANGQLIDENHHVIVTDPYQATDIGYVTPSLFLQDEQRFWNDRIILTGGLRVDFHKASSETYRDIAPSWRFAFLGKWTDWMTMRVSYGYAYKAPSLYQLYVDTFDYVGNPNLKSETLHNVELSFLFTPTYFLKIRLDGFATIMNNLIEMEYSFENGTEFEGVNGRYIPKQDTGALLTGFELGLDADITSNWNLYAHYNFLFSRRSLGNDEWNAIVGDAMNRLKLGFTYMNEYLISDLAFFLVAGKDNEEQIDNKNQSDNDKFKDKDVSTYAILQPQITVALPANLGLMFQASYAFSEGMTKSPTYKYYYEKDQVPVSRYSLMLSLTYPFKK